MKSKLQILAASVLMTASALWLTSCSSDDVVQSGTSKADLSLTLKINTGSVGTRATAWDASNAPQQTDENKINRVAVGIFSSDGSKVKTIVELTPTTDQNPTGSYYQNGIARIVTSSLENGDQVLVAANAPANNFAGVANASAFQAKTETLNDAVLASGVTTQESNDNIPMYGEGNLATSSTSGIDFDASVTVQHQLAKITLDDLRVDFKVDGPYKDAKFTPTEFFVVNVPTTFTFSKSAADGSVHLHGFGNSYGKSAASEWGTYKEYLATGESLNASALYGVANSGTEVCSCKSYFYVTPSSDVTPNGKMKLIIAGDFELSGNKSKVFYPVNLNAKYDSNGNATAAEGNAIYAISPNKNYKCSVTIKTIGTSDPTQNLDPQTAQISVAVDNFVDASQSTTFE